MGVHYTKGMAGKAKKLKLALVTIALGDDFVYQGAVPLAFQMDLLKMMQYAEENYPVSNLDKTAAVQQETSEQTQGEGSTAAVAEQQAIQETVQPAVVSEAIQDAAEQEHGKKKRK